MFRFLRTLYRRWVQAHERNIFHYWDGRRERSVDPLVAFQGLAAHPEYNPAVHPMLVDVGDVDALRVMLQAARDVFNVKAFDSETGEGLTADETISLMCDFAAFVGDAKKKRSPSPISAAPTDSTAETDSPTTNGSASGSASAAPESAAPMPT